MPKDKTPQGPHTRSKATPGATASAILPGIGQQPTAPSSNQVPPSSDATSGNMDESHEAADQAAAKKTTSRKCQVCTNLANTVVSHHWTKCPNHVSKKDAVKAKHARETAFAQKTGAAAAAILARRKAPETAPPPLQQLAPPPVQPLAPPPVHFEPPPFHHFALPPVQPLALPPVHFAPPPVQPLALLPLQQLALPPPGGDVPGSRDAPLDIAGSRDAPMEGVDFIEHADGNEDGMEDEDEDEEDDDSDDDADGVDPKEGPGGRNGRIPGVYKYQDKGPATRLKAMRRNTERPARFPVGKPQSKNTNPKFRAIVQKAEAMSDTIDCWIVCAALPKNGMGDLRLFENEDMARDAPQVKESMQKMLFDALQAKRIQRLAELKRESDENKTKVERAEKKAHNGRKAVEKYKAKLAKATSETERLKEAEKVRQAKKKAKKDKKKEEKQEKKERKADKENKKNKKTKVDADAMDVVDA
ncbi:hypothetical protein AURDEDRAFT_166199 [Auricularia subglabra TFB-10046 SS5]|nr:hypothetical protein AURDEDRAFT_166199 [Auricularia subglabra TFB-10046 SS5]